ncbi:MAG TPA: acyltransferase [Spirochaetota bacterium]|nr:acyltransferase [Spirochaetota bacterium]
MNQIIIKQIDENNFYKYHKSSYIDEGADISSNVTIWHFCHIMKDAQIGKNSSLGQNVFVGSKAFIGENVKIQNNVSVYDNVIIGNDVFIGPSVVFTNVINPRAFINRKEEYKITVIKNGVTIGANATIICGVTVGKYAFIGAGSVVTKDVNDYSLVYGNPAKQKGFVCSCGNKLSDSLNCNHCNKTYRHIDNSNIEEVLNNNDK